MVRRLVIACALLTAGAFVSKAQITTEDLESEIGARVSVTADKKIVKGFHWNVEGEARMGDNLSDFGRYQFGTGLTWKATQWLKLGAGYIFIEDKNSSGEWKPRHRAYGDVTFSYKTGPWRFAIKERGQFTHRDVSNPFQKTPNQITLKSRFKVSYKVSQKLEPYGYVEIRNVFNDPACSATWSATGKKFSDYEFLGYTDTYINRYRGAVGVEWTVNRHSAFDFFVMGDYCYDKNIDTNKEGTKLKSISYSPAIKAHIGIGYTFNF